MKSEVLTNSLAASPLLGCLRPIHDYWRSLRRACIAHSPLYRQGSGRLRLHDIDGEDYRKWTAIYEPNVLERDGSLQLYQTEAKG